MNIRILMRLWKQKYELSLTPMQEELLIVKIQAVADSERTKGIEEGKKIIRQSICDAGNYNYQREAVLHTDSL